MRDLIFISLENWDDIWRRNQFLCAEFTRRWPDMRILFVGIHRDLTYLLRSADFKHFNASPNGHPPGLPNIHCFRPIKAFPTKFTVGRQYNERSTLRAVARHARRLKLRNPILWLNAHYAANMIGHLGESKVIYDITDDWTQFSETPGMRQLIIDQDREVCQRADHVIVCSQKLFDSRAPFCKDLHLIPNGVEIEHYRDVLNSSLPLPAAAANWPKPVLGYTGTFHPDRVDVDLVESVAQKMTAGSIVFVGPAQLPEPTRTRLLATGKVFLHGPVPYRDIPSYMRAFDVCITPHRVTPFTESLNPLKLWEYLAAGKPIISTPVAGFRDYPQHVYLASTPTEFATATTTALTEPLSRKLSRQREVAPHSWEARVNQIAALFQPAPIANQPLTTQFTV